MVSLGHKSIVAESELEGWGEGGAECEVGRTVCVCVCAQVYGMSVCVQVCGVCMYHVWVLSQGLTM